VLQFSLPDYSEIISGYLMSFAAPTQWFDETIQTKRWKFVICTEHLFRTIKMFLDLWVWYKASGHIRSTNRKERRWSCWRQKHIEKNGHVKELYEKQKGLKQLNSNNWNFGSIPPHLLKKGQSKNLVEFTICSNIVPW